MASNLVQGGKVAKILYNPVNGCLAEVIIGRFTLSIALIADGIQSFADAGVSLIVWIGLRISRRDPTNDSTSTTNASPQKAKPSPA